MQTHRVPAQRIERGDSMHTVSLRNSRQSRATVDRLAQFLGWLSVITVALVWFRTGILPASSTGDEVWGSESAWWLLHDGVLRRDMHADAIGSAIRDFLPPIPALGQALVFGLFGLSQFSMGLCSSIAFTVIVIAGFLLARQFELSKAEAIMSAFSLAFIPASAAQILRVRYDVYVVMFVLLALYWLNLSHRNQYAIRPIVIRWLLAGISLGAACISYFGSAPGLALCFLALTGWYCLRTRNPGLFLSFCAGAGLVFAAYGVFVLGDLALFMSQSLASAAAYRAPPLSFNLQSGLATAVFLLFGARMLQLLLAGNNDSALRNRSIDAVFVPLAIAAIVFWAMSLHFYPRYTLLATTLTSVSISLLVAGHRNCAGFFRHAPRILLMAGYALSMAFLLGAVATAIAQRRDRDYSVAAADLTREANLAGLVLTESPGWLALRPLTHSGQLQHLLPKVGDPSDINASSLLMRPEAGADVTSVVVRAGNIAMYRALYPAVDAFMRRDDIAGPIDIAGNSATYRMQLYVRRQP